MSKRNYNPLTEGYSGAPSGKNDGYSGKQGSSAPKKISGIKSAVIKGGINQKEENTFSEKK